VADLLPEHQREAFREELGLAVEACKPFDLDSFREGHLTPVFWGSALRTFGVQDLIDGLSEFAPPPRGQDSATRRVEPRESKMTGFVFKIQANMDPKHRDRVAFVRIVSGRFDAGMQVLHGRTGKMVRLNAPQTFMARERTAVESAWPGDVVGVMDRRELRIGDSLATEPGVVFANIPRFAPEHFARVILSDPMKRKQLDAGLRQLTEEGAAQVFFTSGTDVTSPTPIVGAVGQLQFDVMMHRLAHEYGVTARLEKINSRYPRWITGVESDLARATRDPARTLLYDSKGQPLLLFENEWRMRWALDHEPGVTFHEVSPYRCSTAGYRMRSTSSTTPASPPFSSCWIWRRASLSRGQVTRLCAAVGESHS